MGEGANEAAIAADRNNKNWKPCIMCITKINNAEVDNAEDLDIVMPMYNLLKYSQNCAKKSVSL